MAAGYTILPALPNLPVIGDAFRQFPAPRMTAEVAAIGFILALMIGIGAGIVPAFLSYRARITGLLRQV